MDHGVDPQMAIGVAPAREEADQHMKKCVGAAVKQAAHQLTNPLARTLAARDQRQLAGTPAACDMRRLAGTSASRS